MKNLIFAKVLMFIQNIKDENKNFNKYFRSRKIKKLRINKTKKTIEDNILAFNRGLKEIKIRKIFIYTENKFRKLKFIDTG